ncbi:MAG: hypothetical protein ACOYXT_03760 [Bacteroidota bacterium]
MKTRLFIPENVDVVLMANPEVANNILSTFNRILGEEILKIQDSFSKNDLKSFKSSVHKLKPNFRSLALSEGDAMVKQLNMMVDEKKTMQEMADCYHDFKNYCHDVMLEIDEYLNYLNQKS